VNPFHEVEHGLAQVIAEQGVSDDVHQCAQCHRRNEDSRRHLEHTARDGSDDAQPGQQTTEKHGARTVLFQPALGAVESPGSGE
jgi:hypothetical protein